MAIKANLQIIDGCLPSSKLRLNVSLNSSSDVGMNGNDSGNDRAVESSELEMYLFGAHIVSWKCGNEEMLWMSSLSVNDGSNPLRGGIPVAFPQFADQGDLMLHGFVRESCFSLVEEKTRIDASDVNGSITVVLELNDNETTRKLWNHKFKIFYEVRLSLKQLHVQFNVINTSDSEAFNFTHCLHPYFKTPNIRSVYLKGLKHLTFIDKVDGRKEKCENDSDTENTNNGLDLFNVLNAVSPYIQSNLNPNYFIDRIYKAPSLANNNKDNNKIILIDEERKLTLEITKSSNYSDWVIFNPWIEGKRGPNHPDYDDDGYNYNICIEPAIASTIIHLNPSQIYSGSLAINACINVSE